VAEQVAEQPWQSSLPLGLGIKAMMSSSLLDDHHRHFDSRIIKLKLNI
jgi:hypothetical protein